MVKNDIQTKYSELVSNKMKNRGKGTELEAFESSLYVSEDRIKCFEAYQLNRN